MPPILLHIISRKKSHVRHMAPSASWNPNRRTMRLCQVSELFVELTSDLQVLRWSALGLGVIYGAYHQMSLSAKDKAVHAQKEYDAKAKLISEAKAEFNRKNKPQSVTSAVKSEGKGFDCTLSPFTQKFAVGKHERKRRVGLWGVLWTYEDDSAGRGTVHERGFKHFWVYANLQ